MVYCGKPSKGCLACRSRKTRCDRQTPSCSQCIRAKRECPGYRNQLDLMFRNESQTVIGKATTQKARKQKSPANTNSTQKSSTPSQNSALEAPARNERSYEFFLPLLNEQSLVPGALAPTLEDRALSFYKNKSAIWLRNFDIVELICSQASTDDHLLATLSAVGLASYAASVRSSNLMHRARKDYGKALQLTNQALRSPVKYTNDSTLFAVLALGVFEAVAGNGEESLSAWAKHLAGASELVRLRGPAQFMTEAGQRMFLQIGSNLMVDCVQHGRAMPAHIMALRKGSEPFVNVEDPAWRISDTIIKFTSLRATVMNEKDIDPKKIVQGALEIDGIFIDIVNKLPPTWRQKTIRSDENPDAIWNGFYHIYNDFWQAQMLNTMRVFRIHGLQILREQLDALTPDLGPVFSAEESGSLRERAINTMLEMQAEILASAPQYVPWGIPSFPSTKPIEPWHAYQVLWPLFLAGNMDITTPQVQRWVTNRYLVIAKEAGIEHAAVLAESMRKRQNADAWNSMNDDGYMAQPLKLDPFDWNLDGWVLAHGVILSAQVNRPKELEPSNVPPRNLSAIPPGWVGGPPPGWTGGPPPGWTGGAPPGWKGGPPPGWKGGPPPGWNGGPPPDQSSPDLQRSPPRGWTGGPPPGWKGGPPPGWNGGPLPDQSSPDLQRSPPRGWTGGPPPGWKGGPPPGWSGEPPPDQSSPDLQKSPPPGWTGGPPPGWKGGPPPGLKGITPSNLSSPSPASNSRPDLQKGPPPNISRGPPPGWTGGPPPNLLASVTNASPDAQKGPPSAVLGAPPPGWTGPPPSGWMGNTPTQATSNSRSSSDAKIAVIQNMSSRPPQGISGPPPGWTGPPPPGWLENITPSVSSSNNRTLSDVATHTPQNLPMNIPIGFSGPPPGWTGPPPQGWDGKMPSGFVANSKNGARKSPSAGKSP